MSTTEKSQNKKEATLPHLGETVLPILENQPTLASRKDSGRHLPLHGNVIKRKSISSSSIKYMLNKYLKTIIISSQMTWCVACPGAQKQLQCHCSVITNPTAVSTVLHCTRPSGKALLERQSPKRSCCEGWWGGNKENTQVSSCILALNLLASWGGGKVNLRLPEAKDYTQYTTENKTPDLTFVHLKA